MYFISFVFLLLFEKMEQTKDEPETFGELITLYLSLKKQAKDIESEIDEYKEKILEQLEIHKKDKIQTQQFNVYLRQMTVSRMSKTDCPEEIWNEYSKKITYPSLFITRRNDERKGRRMSKSRSKRSRSRPKTKTES